MDEESVRINIPFFLLPEESKEGDILDITIAKDVQETEDAKERVSSLLEKLKNKNQGMKWTIPDSIITNIFRTGEVGRKKTGSPAPV